MNSNDKGWFARYRGLSRVEKNLACRAFAVLAGTWLCCRTLGMSYVVRRLASDDTRLAGQSEPDDPQTAAGVILAVNRAGRGLGIGTCLDRSLAIESMLRRRGFDARIRLGSGGGGTEPFAHAWVEGPGIPLGAGNQPNSHGTLARRSGARPRVSCGAPRQS